MKMKPYAKLLALSLPLFTLISCKQAPPATETDAAEKPNIILIMTDDQGFGDIGFHGNHLIDTPNLDEMASKSIRFTDFYVSPVCSNTRGALMSGRFPMRAGIWDTFNGGAMMDAELPTLADALSEQGYETAIFGKWHLGDTYPFRPSDRGFKTSLAHGGGGIGQYGDPDNFFRQDSCYFDPVLQLNNKKVQTQGYCTDVFTDAALEYIEAQKEAPFLVYLSYNAPHDPLQVPQKYLDQYAHLKFDFAEMEEYGMPYVKMNEWHKENARRVYGMVSNIDDNVGRVFDQLEKQNLLDNTLVIFMSDNGPMSTRYNAHLKGRKSTVYNGGVKSPLYFYFPEKLGSAREVGGNAAHIDMLPTLLELAGGTTEDLDIDGISLWPLLKGEQEEHQQRSLYWQWDRQLPERYRNMAVRQGDYKLVAKGNANSAVENFELYNTAQDPYEQNNLIARDSDKADELKQELDAWFEQTVMQEGHPRRQWQILDNDAADTLVLTRNDAKGTPEIWGNDHDYGYWDVEVRKEGYYKVDMLFRTKAEKPGRFYIKQNQRQFSVDNADPEAKELSIDRVYLSEGKHRIEAFYKTGWNSISLPLTVSISE